MRCPGTSIAACERIDQQDSVQLMQLGSKAASQWWQDGRGTIQSSRAHMTGCCIQNGDGRLGKQSKLTCPTNLAAAATSCRMKPCKATMLVSEHPLTALAPDCSSCWAASACPWKAAQCRAVSPVLQADDEVDEHAAMHGSTHIQPAKPDVLAFTWCMLLYLLQPPAAALPKVCDPSLLPGPCSCKRSFRSGRGWPWALQLQTRHGGAH